MRLTIEVPELEFPRDARIGPGAFVPRKFSATIEFEDDHAVTLDVEVRDGRPECCAVHVHRSDSRPPLSGDELRRLPITSWVEAATVKAATMATFVIEEPAPGEVWLADDGRRTVRRLRGRATEDEVQADVAHAVRRRQPMTTERLAEVAHAWNECDGSAPAMATMLNVSRAQVYRLIKAAREAGLIEEGGD